MTSMKPVTFKYANEDCESVRGTLITISDQVEQGVSCSSFPTVRVGNWKVLHLLFLLGFYKITTQWRLCFSDFITTLLPKMTNMNTMWIGLKIHFRDMEWLDRTPVGYVNFNPLLVGMQRLIRVNVSWTSLDGAADLCRHSKCKE